MRGDTLFLLCIIGSLFLQSLADQECINAHTQCAITKKCVPMGWKCDGDQDCGENDDSDETDCPPKTCPQDEMKCLNGQCIPDRWMCDGENDCHDGTDESPDVCAGRTCKSDEFDCGDKTCIHNLWRCDGQVDCDNHKDEDDCEHVTTCPSTDFRCESDGRCIDQIWYCDGDKDCFDGSDEANCPKKECKPGEFKCGNLTKCIDDKWKCDGDFDCSDHSDEIDCIIKSGEECQPSEFQCHDSKECIHKSWQCDGDPDCNDGSDEMGECNYTCPPEKFQCANYVCIPASLRCDSNYDCLDESDELNCSAALKCDDETFDCYGDGKHCIPENKVCDGHNDCQHREDEEAGMCKEKDPCLTKQCPGHSYCQKLMTHKGTVAKCDCNRGFEWREEQQDCTDVNECLLPDRCSQICENTKGGYKCSCREGYSLEKFTFCRADGDQPWLYYTNRRDIRRLRADSRYMEVIVESTDNSIALAIDYHMKKLFWTDGALERIHSAEIKKDGTDGALERIHSEIQKDLVLTNGTRTVVDLKQGTSSPDGLAVDWLYKNIYWTDTGMNTIHVANYDGTKSVTLIDEDMDDPRAICLDPEHGSGYMYWTDWGKHARIERSGMDGKNREIIVKQEHGLEWPNGLTIDYIGRKIYWIDAKLHKIGTASLDGTGRADVLVDATEIQRPFSIAVFEDTLYWTDWHVNSIRSVNKFTGRSLQTLSVGLHHVMDIKVSHQMIQTVDFADNATLLCRNAACEYLCLPAASETITSKVSCVCQDGYNLNSDGRTCRTVVTTKKPQPTTLMPTTHVPVVTTEPGYTVVTPNATKTPEVEPEGQNVGQVALVASCIVVLIMVIGFGLCIYLYRRLNSGNKKSMNFDNPVYRKTTTTEDQCVIDSELQPQLQSLTKHESV